MECQYDISEYHRSTCRSQQPQQFLVGQRLRPGGVKEIPARTGIRYLGRQVPGVDRLERVVAVPEDGEIRKAALLPGLVVQQEVPLAEDQRRADDWVGDPMPFRISSTCTPKGSSRPGFLVRVLTLTPSSSRRLATYRPVKLNAPVTTAWSGWGNMFNSLLLRCDR